MYKSVFQYLGGNIVRKKSTSFTGNCCHFVWREEGGEEKSTISQRYFQSMIWNEDVDCRYSTQIKCSQVETKVFFLSLKSNEEREIYHAKRGDENAICTINCSHKSRRNVEGSVCADVLTGIGVGGGMKIDSDIPTFVLWFVWIFSLLWHLTLDLDLECHLDIIDSFLM